MLGSSDATLSGAEGEKGEEQAGDNHESRGQDDAESAKRVGSPTFHSLSS